MFRFDFILRIFQDRHVAFVYEQVMAALRDTPREFRRVESHKKEFGIIIFPPTNQLISKITFREGRNVASKSIACWRSFLILWSVSHRSGRNRNVKVVPEVELPSLFTFEFSPLPP